jgi:hypothetical protein
VDDQDISPLVAQSLFLNALFDGRQSVLRAAEERQEAESAHLFEQDLKKAGAAQRRAAEEEEFARLLREDMRKAEEAQRRAEHEDYVRLLEEDRRRAEEAHRRSVEEEERRRRAEQESQEREHRERQDRERERRERESSETARSNLAERILLYEKDWKAIRCNDERMQHLSFGKIPWPIFENVRGIEDITGERVFAFVCHPRHELQGPGGGQAKSIRSEILRWHPDKFNGKVLEKVVQGDREAVRKAAGEVARILTQFSTEMR